jgi:putative transposase
MKTPYNTSVTTFCIKYRLYPTKAQETLLNHTMALCREVYNSMVIERKALYEMQGKSLSRNDQNKNLTLWKQRFPELRDVHSQVLQNIAERVELAFQAFFRRVRNGEKPGQTFASQKVGYPRLKGVGVYDSITFPQLTTGGCKLVGDYVQVSKIGPVKAVIHRPLIGTPKTCTIRRQAGKWFACFACEYLPDPLPKSEEAVGIDVGLEKFAALSHANASICREGSFVENPRFFRKEEKSLAKAQKKQSKAAKGTKQRGKANKIVSRIHERIRNRRHNFAHQLARKLVNQYGLIAVEKLNVKSMVKNHCLAKSISDASWSQFRSVLTQKAESAARRMVEVNPAYTSQQCSHCGNIAKKPLKERWHHCPICGLSLDRDTNAAFNILNHALRDSKAAVGTHSVVAIAA